ncbi:MFS transporter (plasmid) [Streptomyces sp. NBC_01795]|uniref:MFS transporter n=1 Tax=unclassified Streptomyces TaxID=2593676 RepID=UPI002DDA14CD|nr:MULTISPECIES: MFS transporter [unclassified Streptomyces]WSA97640.1 MFS transporter [Streptomyces sp. NBC_01795]WSB82110.1 MFS transporter [Streptomyces sp. NBC_01775]WSS18081.1 MFS transporter [Streptomyces sp. NBC_01186]
MSTSAIPVKPPIQRVAGAPAVAMFGLLLLAYSVNAMDRMVFPVLLPEVRAEYGFSLDQSGLQSTVFALGMGITGIPAGIALARLSRKLLVVVGTTAFSAATILTIVSTGFADMLVWRILSGVGEALQLAAILTVAAGAFPRHRGLAIGAVNMAFATGSVVGPVVATALLEQHDTWRSPMVVFGVFGLLVTLAVMVLVSRRFTEATSTEVRARTVGGSDSVLSWNPLVLAVITMLFGLADFGYIGLYATYLRDELGFTSGQAGLAVGLSGLAAFASPLSGWLTDRLDPRVCLGSMNAGAAAAAAALFLGPAVPAWQTAFSFLFGLFASGGAYVVLAGLLVKSVHPSIASQGSGMFITCVYVAAGASGYLFSRFVAGLGWTGAGLVQITGFSLAGAALTLLLRPALFSTPRRSESS